MDLEPTTILIGGFCVLLIAALIWWRISSRGQAVGFPGSDALSPGVPSAGATAPPSRRPRTQRHQLRIEERGGERKILLDGSPVQDLGTIADPAARKLVERGEEVLQQAVEDFRAGRPSTGTRRTFTVNGIQYQSLDDIPDPRLRERVKKALHALPESEAAP